MYLQIFTNVATGFSVYSMAIPYCDETCAASGSMAGQLVFTRKLNVLPAKFISGICQLASFLRHCPAFHRLQYTYLAATEISAGGQGTRVLLQYSMLIRMLLAENHSLLRTTACYLKFCSLRIVECEILELKLASEVLSWCLILKYFLGACP